MEFGTEFARALGHLLIQVSPYFLLGAVFAAVLKTYVKPDWTARLFQGNAASVGWASLAGAALPGCACATMPMADGVKSQGARLGTVTAFIVISPLLSPVTLFLTYGMLGWKMTVARLVVPFVFSFALGLALNALERRGATGFAFPAGRRGLSAIPVTGASCTASAGGRTFLGSLFEVLRELAPYFLLGMLLAALLTTLVPEEAIPRYIGGSGPSAYLLAALVGIPVYVCEGEEVPLTYALMQLGLGPGPAFTFLLGSVGTCIPTMVMARKLIGDAATLVYIAAWFVFAIASGWLLSLWY